MELEAITSRWTIVFALVYIFSSSFAPYYSLIFLSIALLLGLVRMYQTQMKSVPWMNAFGIFYFTMFFMLPWSNDVFHSIRQFMTYLTYFIAFIAPVYLLTTAERRDFLVLLSAVLLVVHIVTLIQLMWSPVFPILQMISPASRLSYVGLLVNIYPLLLVEVSSAKNSLSVLLCCSNMVISLVLMQYFSAHTSMLAIFAVTFIFLMVVRNSAVFSRTYAVGMLSLIFIVCTFFSPASTVGMIRQFLALYTDFWGSELQQFLGQHWLTGIGLNGFSQFFYFYHTTGEFNEIIGNLMNTYVNLLAETGVIGLTSFVAMFVVLLRDKYGQLRAEPNNPWHLSAVLMIIGFLLHITTFHYFIIPGIMHVFFLFLGMSYVVADTTDAVKDIRL